MNATCKIHDIMEKPYNTAMRYSVAALDFLDEEIYLLDSATFSIIHANRAAIENTGYNAAELLWRNVFEIKPHASYERLKEELVILSNRDITRRDYSLTQLRKDGTTYDTEESLHVFDNSDRAMLMLMVRDITERRQADEMMLNEWERATATLDAVADPVIVTDANAVITRLNQASTKLIAIPACDAVGAPLDTLIRFAYPRARETLGNVVDMCIKEGKEIRLDLLTFSTRNDSRERMVNLSLAPVFSGEGNIVSCVLTLRSVT